MVYPAAESQDVQLLSPAHTVHPIMLHCSHSPVTPLTK